MRRLMKEFAIAKGHNPGSNVKDGRIILTVYFLYLFFDGAKRSAP